MSEDDEKKRREQAILDLEVAASAVLVLAADEGLDSREMLKGKDDGRIATQVVIDFIRSESEHTAPIFGVRVDLTMKEGKRTILNYRRGGGARTWGDSDIPFPDPSPDDDLKKVN